MKPVVAHRLAKVRAAFERIPGADLSAAIYRRDQLGEIEVPGEKIMAGIPNMAWSHITRWAGGDSGGHIGFSPVVPLTGSEVLRARDLLAAHVHAAGMDYLAGLLPINARSLIHITMLMFDTADEARTRDRYELARRLVSSGAARIRRVPGHVDFMDAAAAQYSFGDHAYRRFCEDAEGRDQTPGRGGDPRRRARTDPAIVECAAERRRQTRASRSRTISVAAAGAPLTKPKNGPKSRVAEKPVT